MKHRIRAIGAAAVLHCVTAVFLAFNGATHAQESAPPTPPQSEIQKWIATTDAQWQATFKREVTDVREAELTKVKEQYRTSLEAAIAKASTSGDLDGAVVLRNEQERFVDTKTIADVYPWGMQWVQRKRAGNYGQSLGTDTFEKTAPVGSFAANGFGIYDLGGNVWEWCEDSFYSSRNSRVIRGASWVDVDSVTLRSSCRHGEPPSDRHGNVGFRLVVSGR